MPVINVQPMKMRNGDTITSYMDTVGTTDQTFTFLTTQETVILTNKGTKDITYTIGSSSGTLGRSENVKVIGSIASLTLRSEQGTQAFEIWADEAGANEEGGTAGLAAQLAQSTTFNVESYPIQVPETDDKARVLRAINAMGSKGVLTFADNKTYTFNTQLTFTKNNISIIVPKGAVINSASNLQTSLIKVTNSSNVVIYGYGLINGNNSGTAGDTANALIHLEGCTDCYIDGLSIKNTKYVGILLSNSTACKVRTCIIDDVGTGIRLTSGGKHNISSNTIRRSTPAGDALTSGQIRGIKASTSIQNLIFGNHIVNYDMGVEVWSSCNRSIISSNVLYGCTFGISVDTSDNSTVVSNTIEGDPTNLLFNTGIELAGSSYCTMQGNNIVIPATVTSGSRKAIGVWEDETLNLSSDYSIVSGNNVKGGITGIQINKSSHSTIADNTIVDSTVNGIAFKANVNMVNIKVKGNNVINPLAEGIYVQQNTDGTGVMLTPNEQIDIIDNTVVGSGKRGIEYRSNGVVKGNVVKNSQKSGIMIWGSNNANRSVLLESNFCTGNVADLTTAAFAEAGLYVNINAAYTNMKVFMYNNVAIQAENNNNPNQFVEGGGKIVSSDVKKMSSTIGTTETTLNHFLGYVPTSIQITAKGNGVVWQSTNATKTAVFLTASVSTPVDVIIS